MLCLHKPRMKGKYVGGAFAKRAAGGGIAAKSGRTEWPSEGDRKRAGGVWKPERRSVNKRRYVTAYTKVGAYAPSRVAPQEFSILSRQWDGIVLFSKGKQRNRGECRGDIKAKGFGDTTLSRVDAKQPQGGTHDPKVKTMVNGEETPCHTDPLSAIANRKETSSWNRFRIKFI